MTDQDLLRQFVDQKRQAAFTELARRHLDLVYGAARRMVNGDAHLAADVAQQVFVDLARKAPKLTAHPCLTGWLYACTRFTALSTLRTEQRRAAREQEADMINETPSPDWAKLRPVIDDALQELNERDREFVLLRYFEQQPLGAIAQQFGVSENAAQKAVARSLDVLNAALSRRGITSTAVALGLTLGAATVAAPASLLSSVSAAALAAGVAAGVATGVGGGAVVAKWAAVLVLVGGLAGTAGYWRAEQRATAANAAELRQHDAEAAARVRGLEARVRQESARATSAEADLGRLLQAVEQERTQRAAVAAAQAAAAAQATAGAPIDSQTPPARALKGTVYTVQPGDTAAKIAHAYGLTTKDVTDANANVNFARLRVGQIITLPPGAALVDPAKAAARPSPEYTVKPGDTATWIVAKTGVGLAELRQLNPGIDWTALAPGQQIRLK